MPSNKNTNLIIYPIGGIYLFYPNGVLTKIGCLPLLGSVKWPNVHSVVLLLHISTYLCTEAGLPSYTNTIISIRLHLRGGGGRGGWCGWPSVRRARGLPFPLSDRVGLLHQPFFAVDDVDAGGERRERRAVEVDAVALQVVDFRGLAGAGLLQVLVGGHAPQRESHVEAGAA